MIFPFSKFFSRKSLTDDLSAGMIDGHCHILPGVDDGVKTIEESLNILGEYEALGFSEIWLTPHVMEDIPNTAAKLTLVYDELVRSYKGGIKLHLAAENMMDTMLNENIADRNLLAIGDEADKLLVETSYYDRPANFYDTLEEIMSLGLTPVLAHPERYNYMAEKDYTSLKQLGVLFQLNLFSLGGYYGQTAKKKAESLLGKRMYDFTGTDLHSIRQISLLSRVSVAKKHRDYLFEISHNQL